MVDIISLAHTGAGGLPPSISCAREQVIAEKYASINDELGKLRLSTIGSTYVASDGTLKVNPSDGLSSLLIEISEKEKTLNRLIEIVNQINKILGDANVETILELSELKNAHLNEIQSAPVRAWEAFRLHRELPAGQGGYPDLLPSDLVLVASFKAIEDDERAKFDAAKIAVEPVSAAWKEVVDLYEEAASL